MKSLIVLYILLAGTTCLSAPMLYNRSFESGDLIGWETHGLNWSTTDKHASEGRIAAECAVMKGDAPELRACSQPINGVYSGKSICLSLDVSAIAVTQSPNSKGTVLILCVDAEGKPTGEFRQELVEPKATFMRVQLDVDTVPVGTVEAHLMLLVEITRPAVDGDWWLFDNVNIQIK